MRSGLGHLARRAVTSLSRREPVSRDVEEVTQVLNNAEYRLWAAMTPADRRHSIEVLRRFDRIRPGSERAERAAALLHDVGKTASGLGWAARIAATVAGPRTTRFRTYHDHEVLGAAMLRGLSDARTVEIVAGCVDDPATEALRRADET